VEIELCKYKYNSINKHLTERTTETSFILKSKRLNHKLYYKVSVIKTQCAWPYLVRVAKRLVPFEEQSLIYKTVKIIPILKSFNSFDICTTDITMYFIDFPYVIKNLAVTHQGVLPLNLFRTNWRILVKRSVTYSGLAWLIIMGSGFDDWVY
jgi:hypothetical protein